MLVAKFNGGILASLLKSSRGPVSLAIRTRLVANGIAAPSVTLSSRRCFAIPAKPKKGSSAENSSRTRKPRVKSTTSDENPSTPAKKRSAPLTPEARAAKKEKARELLVKKREKAAAKKAKAQLKKKTKKPVTEEAKARKKVLTAKAAKKDLKLAALDPPQRRTISAWLVFCGEHVKSNRGPAKGVSGDEVRSELANAVRGASQAWHNLTPAEREHYNHLANERSASRDVEYKAYVKTFTPGQILVANSARRKLRVQSKGKKVSTWAAIDDDRIPKQPASAYIAYSVQRMATGDFKNILPTDRTKLVAEEWKELDQSEKREFEDVYAQQRAEYKARMASIVESSPESQVDELDVGT